MTTSLISEISEEQIDCAQDDWIEIETSLNNSRKQKRGNFLGGDWLDFAPVVTSGVGAIASYTSGGKYKVVGNICFAHLNAVIINKGTSSASIVFSLPLTCAYTSVGCGRENAITGTFLQGYVGSGQDTMTIYTYDNTYPAVNNANILMSISYPIS